MCQILARSPIREKTNSYKGECRVGSSTVDCVGRLASVSVIHIAVGDFGRRVSGFVSRCSSK